MTHLLTPPTLEDLIRLLKAWRFWMFGALVGALIGAAVYYADPPPFRAQATVNVDFNLEQAWPQETDRQQFYYLERESRKLEEVAWSDEVLGQLSSSFGISVEELRRGKLQLSQPAEAGWHFYADRRRGKTRPACRNAAAGRRKTGAADSSDGCRRNGTRAPDQEPGTPAGA